MVVVQLLEQHIGSVSVFFREVLGAETSPAARLNVSEVGDGGGAGWGGFGRVAGATSTTNTNTYTDTNATTTTTTTTDNRVHGREPPVVLAPVVHHHRRRRCRRRRRRPLAVHVAGDPSLRPARVVGLFAGVEAVPEGVGRSLVERLVLGLPKELPVRGDAGVAGPEVARVAQRVPVKERRRRVRGVVVVVVVVVAVVALRETDAVHFVVRLLGVGVVVGV